MSNYTVYHLHTDLSNPNMVECVNKYSEYVDKAKAQGMKAIAFTEHGNMLSWYNKKMYAEKQGLKYIHGVETYVTESIDEKIRDNYHCVLLAKNYDGVLELNELISQASKRDGHFYYNARITFDELFNTSDNIIVTTACLAGFINITKKQDRRDLGLKTLQFLQKNKHRCFLEIQPHANEDQINLNNYLYMLNQKLDIPLIAGTDTHALNEESDKARKMMQKSKKIVFALEDEFDLTFHTYDKLHEMFVNQISIGSKLNIEDIEQAINNTNVLADMVEPFDINYDKKYPKLYDNPEDVLAEKIKEGIKFRNIDKMPEEQKLIYMNRIQEELDVYRENEAIDYILLDDMVKCYARENGVRYGFGRGSVSGSLIAYLIQLTNVDPIKRNLSFARFMSKERVSLADIDTDYAKEDRPMLVEFLSTKLNVNPVITYNTIQTKGAIRDIGRGLEMSISKVDQISNAIDTPEEQKWREEEPLLFYYVDIVVGTVVSIGSHPCAVNVTNLNTEQLMGTITIIDSKTKEPVNATMLNMKEVEAQNFVKLDLLLLDTVGILSKTVDYVGLKWENISPDFIDDTDVDVWNSIKEDNTGIFQWESDFSKQIFRELFSDKTISKIKTKNPDFSYIDLFSLGNAILRPSGASYRDSVIAGEFYDNGNDVLNDFLASTLGRLVYQENLIQFLVKFCGYTEGHSDLIRRGIGKVFLPLYVVIYKVE